jgi:hypothetical protein
VTWVYVCRSDCMLQRRNRSIAKHSSTMVRFMSVMKQRCSNTALYVQLLSPPIVVPHGVVVRPSTRSNSMTYQYSGSLRHASLRPSHCNNAHYLITWSWSRLLLEKAPLKPGFLPQKPILPISTGWVVATLSNIKSLNALQVTECRRPWASQTALDSGASNIPVGEKERKIQRGQVVVCIHGQSAQSIFKLLSRQFVATWCGEKWKLLVRIQVVMFYYSCYSMHCSVRPSKQRFISK